LGGRYAPRLPESCVSRRNRRNRARRQQPLPGPRSSSGPVAPVAAALVQQEEREQPLAHRRLEERALRSGWLPPGPRRDRVIDRLMQVVDRSDPEGEHDRYATAAGKALIGAELRQQALDFQREQAAREAYEQAGAEMGGTGQAEAVDPARYDWYGESCPCGLPPGECREHPRARASQRPPEGDWRVWAYVAGRGAGKTRAGAAWIQSRVDAGLMKLGCLIAPTAADIRDIMVEGPSGLLAVGTPDNRPRFESSKRRIVWPNGAWAVCLSGEEPDRARGLNVDTIWADELACWRRAQQTWDLAILALRAGTDCRALITTTPRRVPVLKRIVGEASTVRTTDTTFANRANLPAEFLGQIVALFEGTRLGRQEIYAEFLDTAEGVWFATFDPRKHVSESAEYHPGYPVRLAIDCGTSQFTGAVWFQVREIDQFKRRVTVFGDFLSSGSYSAANAAKIKERSGSLPSSGRLDLVRVDPAARAETGIGPAAYGEYERVFGRLLAKWPSHGVVDGLEFLELLLETDCLVIHPRCGHLVEAFKNYRRKEMGGIVVNYPADGHPEEDLMDALRGGVRDAMPEGRKGPSGFRQHRMTGAG